MALFQDKKVFKRPRKNENKNYCVVMFLPDGLQKIPKKQKKNKKKYHSGFISSQNPLKEDENERK